LKGFVVERNSIVYFTEINQLRSSFGECFLRLFVKACYALPQLITFFPALPTVKKSGGLQAPVAIDLLANTKRSD
ncbi:TPA: hypothetical protein ACWSBC_005266, partial [Escherichia coli]